MLNFIEVPLKFNSDSLAEFEDRLLNGLSQASRSVVVLMGTGTYFSTGMDLSYITTTHDRRFLSQFNRILKTIKTSPLPVLAKVDGKVIGGGVALVAVADIVLSSDMATFSLPEVSIGLTPTIAMSCLLERMKPQDLKTFVWSTQTHSAIQAFEWGIVDKVVPRQDLDAEVDVWCRKLSRIPVQVVSETKQLLTNLHFHESRIDAGCRQLAKKLKDPHTIASLAAHLEGVRLFNDDYAED